MTPQPVHDATTIILVREEGPVPCVLMGRRARNAVFMAGKLVFPGGRAEPGDAALAPPLPDALRRALAREASSTSPEALVGAGLRELREETGLRLAADAALRFVFRAVTPPGRTRRFDARFLLASARAVLGDPDDFSGADGELSDLGWLPLGSGFPEDVAFITAVVLAELPVLLHHSCPNRPIPFFRDDNGLPRVVAL